MSYWEECISEAFEEAEIFATPEQISAVAYWVEGAHENYGMAMGNNVASANRRAELDREREELQRELKMERNKVVCDLCGGKGRLYIQGPYHGADTECDKCCGTGKVTP